MIKFKKVIGEGFGSFIEETPFKLDRPGLNVIIAKNGEGKTTVFSLLYWVLYGTTLKNIKSVTTWEKYQPKGFKGTKGSIKLIGNDKSKYEIIRCKDYKGEVLKAKGGNRLIVLRNGEDISPRDKSERQALINKIIGYTPELFLNSIIFGQRLKRLIQESGPNKKKVFEEAFESQFINQARITANQDYKIIQEELTQLTSQKLDLENLYKLKKEHYHDLKESKANFKQDIKNQVYKLEAEIGEYLKINKRLEDKLKDKNTEVKYKTETLKLKKLSGLNISKIEDEEFRLKNRLDKVEYEASKIEYKIKGLKESYKESISKCPRCGSKLNVEKAQAEKSRIKKELTELELSLEVSKKDVSQAKKEYEVKLKELSSLSNQKKEIESLEKSVKLLEKDLEQRKYNQISIESNQKIINKLEALITEAKSKKFSFNLNEVKEQSKKAKKDLKVVKKLHSKMCKRYDNYKWLLNDALSNKGLKNYIFDTMLVELNNQLQYYTQFIGMCPKFAIDFTSANKDIYSTVIQDDGNEVFYEELSGGQQQLIDVVTAFALYDITVSQRPCSIMVLDEVFEGLDESNADLVFDIINSKSENRSLFLITHNIALQNSSTKVIRLHRNKSGQTIFKMLEP